MVEDRIHDGAVLRLFGAQAGFQIFRMTEHGLVEHPVGEFVGGHLVDAQEQGTAAHGDDQRVELAGQLAQAGHIREADQFHRPREQALQLLASKRVAIFRCESRGGRFDHQSQAVGIQHLLVGQLDDAHAAIRFALCESRRHE